VRRSALVAICLTVVLSACATSGGTASATAAAAPGDARTNAPRITAQEIAEANLPTAYDVVDRLRRPWLRRSGAGGEVVVYMDERNIGGAAELRNIPATTVAELQYVTHEDAVRRWGGGMGGIRGGVIVVIRRR